MSSKSASQDMVDIEKGIKSEATRDHDDVLKQDVGRDVTASALSSTLSSGLSPPNSSAPIVATTQEPEERRKRQERLNEHDKALYDLVRAQKDSPEGLRALFVGEDALKYTTNVAVTEFYDFYNLQACNIINLRKTLVNLSNEILIGKKATDEQMELMRETLHQYYNALRDIEFMFSKKPAEQAVQLPGTYGPVTAEMVLPQPKEGTGGTDKDAAGIQRLLDFGVFTEEKMAQVAKISALEQRFLRIRAAAVASAALLVPMLIMALHPGRNTSVITTSIAISIVTVSLAFLKVDQESVLLYSAAYAAVLIVFVGGSLNGG